MEQACISISADRKSPQPGKLRAAVIGCGVIAHIHFDALDRLEDVALCAVCDIDKAKAADAPKGVPFYTDYRELYEKERPDAVHICLPHDLHYPVSRWFAERGVHVFCEKPAALNAVELEKFIRLEEAHPELKLCVCLQNRLNDSTQKLLALLAGGEYGKVVSCLASNPWTREQGYYDAGPWRGAFNRSGGGCMINQAIHLIDLMCQVCGNAKSVKGAALRLLDLDTDVEDTAAARIEFEGGARGIFFATNANRGSTGPYLEVRTEKAAFVIDNRRLYRLDDEGERVLLVKDAVLQGEKYYYGSSHIRVMERFYHAIRQDSRDYFPIREAQMSNLIIDAINRSGATGREIPITPLRRAPA